MGSRRPLAVVTGGASGIGRELARQCIAHGFDLVLIADSDDVHDAARHLGADVARVYSQKHDLSSHEGVDTAYREIQALSRRVNVLMLDELPLARRLLPLMAGGHVLVTSSEVELDGVTVTFLPPGQSDDLALVARQAFTATINGERRVRAGSLKERLKSFFSSLLPQRRVRA